MSTANKPALSLGYVDCDKVLRITVQDGKATWVYDSTGTVETHDPLDRVGGPYRISDYVESDGDKWFLFWVVDCYFPLADLVRGSSFEDAYETYLDWAADKRHIAIDEADLKDYLDKNGDYQGSMTSNGVPVETDNIQGREVSLAEIHFQP